ncbi:MAG: sensor histidine kinase, partial [Limisphaerales bacterium]
WHTAGVLGTAGTILLMALSWAGLLRRQVQQRTCELRAEIEERKRAEEELKKAQGDLLRASRLAGMAEVATSVLHNVGNVLNSVNVSINMVFDQVKTSKVSNVARVSGLLREHAQDMPDFLANDPKGRQLPSYLNQLSDHLAREQGALLNELESLRKNTGHIKDIVATQQSYAKVVGVTETIKVTELVEDALRVNMEALARHDVRLVREFDPGLPAISVDKHKVLQILVNLIRNAKHACDDAGRGDKQLTVRVANGEGKLKISVMDNGVGIAPENLTRIFNHGFTTRKNGHGFGLHSGALAAKELGGALVATSDGPGKGATFILELPVGGKN